MKTLGAFLLISVFSCLSFAANKIQLNSIGVGQNLQIIGIIELPPGQKLNSQAPSKVAVFEKVKDQWVLTENVNLNEFFSLTDLIQFQKPVQLKSDISEIKIEASLYHCPRIGKGICVIDDFEGSVKRDLAKTKTEIKLALKGNSPPK